MSDKNIQSECGFKGEMVSYLYDEIEAREKAIFETHLAKCPSCADELAEFSFARFAVKDWRDAEFSNLATPAFEIPFREKSSNETISGKFGLRFAEWLRIFTAAPVWSASVAVLALVVGLIIAANSIFQPDLVAENNQHLNVSTSVAKSSEIPSNVMPNETKEIVAQEIQPSLNKKSNSDEIASVKRQSVSAIKKDSIHNAAANPPKIKSGRLTDENAAVLRTKNTNKTSWQNGSSVTRQIPMLNNFEDEDDNTLRLAELFDQVGSGK